MTIDEMDRRAEKTGKMNQRKSWEAKGCVWFH